MMKKEYTVPTIEVINMEFEKIVASSPIIGGGTDNDMDAGGSFSNKRQQPVVSTWSSSNWNSAEEF